MKVQAREIAGFLKSPPAGMLAVLVYGPDEGLVRERLDLLARTAVADIRDPFSVVEVSAAALAENPARLLDEAQSISMLGGRRVVRLQGATDKAEAAVKNALGQMKPGDNLVLVEGGNLGPRSALRLLFEREKNAAALPCYVEDARDLSRVAEGALREAGFSFTSDVISALAAGMVGDRAVARSEIEKLVTYMGAEKRITLEHVAAVSGGGAALPLDDLARHVASGRFAEADKILDFVLSEGLAPVTVLRTLQNHFTRLHITKVRMEKGESIDAAMARLKPAVFFKLKDAFVTQVSGWSLTQLETALALLMEAEAKCKQTGSEPHLLCSRALLSLSQTGLRATGARRRA